MYPKFCTALLSAILICTPIQAQTLPPQPLPQQLQAQSQTLKGTEMRLELESQRIQQLFQLFQRWHPENTATLQIQIKEATVYAYLQGPAVDQLELQGFLQSPPSLHLKVKNTALQNAVWQDLGPLDDFMRLPEHPVKKQACQDLIKMGLQHIQPIQPIQSIQTRPQTQLLLEFNDEDRTAIKNFTGRNLGKTLGFFFDQHLLTMPIFKAEFDANTLSVQGPENPQKAEKLAQQIKAEPERLELKVKSTQGWIPLTVGLHLKDAKVNTEKASECSSTDLIAYLRENQLQSLQPYLSQSWGIFFEDEAYYLFRPLENNPLGRFISIDSLQEREKLLIAWYYQYSNAPLKIVLSEQEAAQRE